MVYIVHASHRYNQCPSNEEYKKVVDAYLTLTPPTALPRKGSDRQRGRHTYTFMCMFVYMYVCIYTYVCSRF